MSSSKKKFVPTPPLARFVIRAKVQGAVWKDIGDISLWQDGATGDLSGDCRLYAHPTTKFKVYTKKDPP